MNCLYSKIIYLIPFTSLLSFVKNNKITEQKKVKQSGLSRTCVPDPERVCGAVLTLLVFSQGEGYFPFPGSLLLHSGHPLSLKRSPGGK